MFIQTFIELAIKALKLNYVFNQCNDMDLSTGRKCTKYYTTLAGGEE